MQQERGVPVILDHGGDLAGADALFPTAPKPWLDLSTGINPHSYSFTLPPQTAFARLPGRAETQALEAIAADAYGAVSSETVTAAPGTQILLPLAMALVPAGQAVVLGPTYAEHARAARLAGHDVLETAQFSRLAEADLAIVVNPNNPDGRLLARDELLGLAHALSARGGLLVVDEAFMDVGRQESMAAAVCDAPIVLLRSFGKFFGLAGVRLGFAIAAPTLAGRLRAALGPWAVSGPALAIGAEALRDRAWRTGMRERLRREAEALDAVIETAGLEIVGGTDLFRLARHDAAEKLWRHLASRGILARRFDRDATLLRFGLPGSPEALSRLAAALGDFHGGRQK